MNGRTQVNADSTPQAQIYTLTVYLAAPGTPVMKPAGEMHRSAAGHAYYSINGDGKEVGYGFSPIESGLTGPGHIVMDEQDEYKNPAYSRTMQITKAQYLKLKEYGDAGLEGSQAYFSLDYNGANNSCIDFVWKGLRHAGLNVETPLPGGQPLPKERFDGTLRVLDNAHWIHRIPAPFPGSPHNKEETQALPARDWLQKLLTEQDAVPAPGRRVPDSIQDPQHPGHHDYRLAFDAVRRMEAAMKIEPGPHTEKLSAALAAKAAQAGFDTRQVRLQMAPGGQLHVTERSYQKPDKHHMLDTGHALGCSVAQHSAAWCQARSPYYAHGTPAAQRTPEQAQLIADLAPGQRALFERYRAQLPPQINDDQVFQALADGRWQAHIHRPEQLGEVILRGERLFARHASPAGLVSATDLNQSPPPMRQSVEQDRALVERNEQVAQQQGPAAQQSQPHQEAQQSLSMRIA